MTFLIFRAPHPKFSGTYFEKVFWLFWFGGLNKVVTLSFKVPALKISALEVPTPDVSSGVVFLTTIFIFKSVFVIELSGPSRLSLWYLAKVFFFTFLSYFSKIRGDELCLYSMNGCFCDDIAFDFWTTGCVCLPTKFWLWLVRALIKGWWFWTVAAYE